jgi:hypothetical protein
MQFGVYGNSQEFIRVVAPKVRTALMAPFFNQYITERFGAGKPLAKLVTGKESVPDRYKDIRFKAVMRGEGIDFFDAVRYDGLKSGNIPQFMRVTQDFRDNPTVKDNVQLSLIELLSSDDEEIRQWANDFVAYMFYVSGGTDQNAGGLVRTTIYDIIPPEYLANITLSDGTTFNDYMSNVMSYAQSDASDRLLEHVKLLLAITDDNYIKIFNPRKTWMDKPLFNDDVIIIKGKDASKLLSYYTGKYDEYMKVRTDKGYDLYKLGNIVETENKKTGRKYTNPVYYKVNQLGYRNNKIRSYAIRADGQWNTILNKYVSLLNNSQRNEATDYEQLSEINKKKFDTSVKYVNIYTVDEYNDKTNLVTQ